MNTNRKYDINAAIVVIGRNEGNRLIECFNSFPPGITVIYVDSNSSDDSVSIANQYRAEVIELDVSKPFTAARARNAGYYYLKNNFPNFQFIQFIDGDCTLDKQWLNKAIDYLIDNIDVALVCGRRRERYPSASFYNYMCDLEWDTPLGDSLSCGGDFLVRSVVFDQVHGFTDELIAGEEPDLCFRIRQQGWKVWRLDYEMTVHDADMHHFSQWWRRTKRAGYAFAEGALTNGYTSERYWVREALSAWLWAAFLPVLITLTGFFSLYCSLALFIIYLIQILRIYLRFENMDKFRLARSILLIIGKFAELSGQIKYLLKRITRQSQELIEYK
jgi:glycosyltransferase involved in cell wall biosynthesis